MWRSIPSAGTALRPLASSQRWIRSKGKRLRSENSSGLSYSDSIAAPGPGRKRAANDDVDDTDVALDIDQVAQVPATDATPMGAVDLDAPDASEQSSDELEMTLGTKVASRSTAKRMLDRPFDDGLVAESSESASESESEFAETEEDEMLASGEALAEADAYQEARASISAHLARLRRIDLIALQEERERSRASSTTADIDISTGAELDSNAGAVDMKALPDPGPPVDYCIFCYHGTFGLLRPDNGLLLSRFVSERGSILPKRFTKCCPKHQRKLAATIRRARNMNLLPFHSKLHPRLRFGSLLPAPPAYLEQHAGVLSGGSAAVTAPRGLPGHADPVKVQQALNRAAV